MRSTFGRFDTRFAEQSYHGSNAKNYLCVLLSLLDNLGCGSGIKACFMPLALHEISASHKLFPLDGGWRL